MENSKLHRLTYKSDALFSGQLIDRGKPVHFTLNSRAYKGFSGDSVLSAILGSGVDTIGKKFDEEIALTPNFCPPVMDTSDPGAKVEIVPMNRMPALEGMQLFSPVFKGQDNGEWKKPFHLPFISRGRSLKYEWNGSEAFLDFYAGDVGDPVKEVENFDLVVVGGGVAGLGAAKAAIELGWRVALIEQRAKLGGDAVFFGAIEGEKRPKDFIENLLGEMQKHDRLRIFLNAKAYSLNNNNVLVHQVSSKNNTLATRRLCLNAKHIILATGLLERPPIFCGNRLPGVMGARTAFDLAADYGLWNGQSSAFSTASSVATQVALLASDMGIIIEKLVDSRASPKSRFFEFSKAYGISLATGTQVSSCQSQQQKKLLVQFELSSYPSKEVGEALLVDSLIICGGWLPNLNLWIASGGKTKWNEQAKQLQAFGMLENIILTGACAGAASMSECVASGKDAILELAGKKKTAQSFFTIDFEHESRDGELPIAKNKANMAPRYLDMGNSFKQPEKFSKKTLWSKIFSAKQDGKKAEITLGTGYSLVDLTAKITLGEIPEKFAGFFAKERCCVNATLNKLEKTPMEEKLLPPLTTELLPKYLHYRFGEPAEIVELNSEQKGNLEIGCLVYRDQKNIASKYAIGAVIALDFGPDKKILAYINKTKTRDLSSIVIRNGTYFATISI